MRWISILLSSVVTVLFAQNPLVLEHLGVKTKHTVDGVLKEIHIERSIPSSCINVGIDAETIFSGNYAGLNVPKECQKSFVTVVGKAQPMMIAEGVRTVGEVEVLDFIQNKQGVQPQAYILVDSRKRDWFEQMTIPSSTSLPYDEIEYDAAVPEDFERVMTLLNFKKRGDTFDFTNAKTALFFCNGPWCVQSRWAIEKLIKLGYPKEKLLWYRGGLQDWLLFGFTVVKNNR